MRVAGLDLIARAEFLRGGGLAASDCARPASTHPPLSEPIDLVCAMREHVRLLGYLTPVPVYATESVSSGALLLALNVSDRS